MDGDKKIIRLVCMYYTCQYIYNTYMYCVWTWWRRKHFFLLLLPFAGDNNMTFIDRFCQKATAQLSSLSNHSRLQIIWHHLLQQWVSKRACLEDVQNIDTLSRYRWHRVCTSKNVCMYYRIYFFRQITTFIKVCVVFVFGLLVKSFNGHKQKQKLLGCFTFNLKVYYHFL